MKPMNKRLNIAVVGAGVSGITAAYLLQKKHNVTLFEKNDYFGGHTNTIRIPSGPDAGAAVDTGFIVLNYRTYPNFIRFLDRHGVRTEKTDMSLSYCEPDTGFCYATQNLNALFARRKNLLAPRHWRFLFEIRRFMARTKADYYNGRLEGLTLGAYLRKLNYSDDLIHRFVIPWSAAIWSAADVNMTEFPMRTFAQFYENHGLLSVEKEVPWYFIKGGSQTYVQAFLKSFEGTARSGAAVKRIRRDGAAVTLTCEGAQPETFDKVVIAAHADEALAMLDDPTPDEKRLLGAWTYSKNRVYLHTDLSWMPENRRSWASWNYLRLPGRREDAPCTVTYYMNRLQNLKTQRAYLVTLNPARPIPEEHVIKEILYTHPLYTFASFQTQPELGRLNGKNRTYFCGAYFGYGFHEDGAASAATIGGRFGVTL